MGGVENQLREQDLVGPLVDLGQEQLIDVSRMLVLSEYIPESGTWQ